VNKISRVWARSDFRFGLLALLLSCGPLVAQSPLVLTDDDDVYSLAGHLEVLEEGEAGWTIETVTSPEVARRFVPYRGDELDLGITRSAWWVRLRLRDESRHNGPWRLLVDRADILMVDFYRPSGDGYSAVLTGFGRPFATREIAHDKFLFRVDPRTSPEDAVYLRVQDRSRLFVPLKVLSLEAFTREEQVAKLRSGIVHGAMFIMFGYNLILFLVVRSKEYLYYTLFLFFMGLTTLSFQGLVQLYLIPGFSSLADETFHVSLHLSVFFALRFASVFLRIRQPRWLVSAFRALSAAHLLLAVTAPFAVSARLTMALMLISSVTMILAGLVRWHQGHRPARTFTLAWTLLLTSFVVKVLEQFEVLPSGLLPNALQIGLLLLVLLLALGLAERINTERQEKLSAQTELVREQETAMRTKDELNAALRISQTQLRARNAELESLTHAFSHDLKSPLVTIKGFAGLLGRAAADDRQLLRRYLDTINDAADEADRLLEGLLEMSRGRHLAAPEVLAMPELAREAVARMQATLDEAGARVEILPGMPAIQGDRARLVDVLCHLIGNAVRFREAERELRIEIGAREDGGGTAFYVRDNSSGIDPRYHHWIFGLFNRLDPGRGGTGIGLAIVQQVVEMHGGRVWVESAAKGQGSTFYVHLPGPQAMGNFPADLR
jgi:signal transduction histidine kinase